MKHTCQLVGRPLASSTISGFCWLLLLLATSTLPTVSFAAFALLRLTFSRLHKTRNISLFVFKFSVSVGVKLTVYGVSYQSPPKG